MKAKSEELSYQKIKEKILSFEYHPGIQLREMALAKKFELSRGAVRKVITKLSNDGLVQTFPGRGAFVASLSQKEIEDIFEVRELLEIKAAHLAIHRSSRDDLDRIQSELDKRDKKLQRKQIPERYMKEMDFHYELVKLSKNQILVSVWESLRLKLHLVRIQSTVSVERFIKNLQDHKIILDCIRQGDHTETERLVKHHIQRVKIFHEQKEEP